MIFKAIKVIFNKTMLILWKLFFRCYHITIFIFLGNSPISQCKCANNTTPGSTCENINPILGNDNFPGNDDENVSDDL